MTAYNKVTHANISEPVQTALRRYSATVTIPGNPIDRYTAHRLLAIRYALNLVVREIEDTHALFTRTSGFEITAWVERTLDVEETILYFKLDNSWMIFNTMGDFMGFIWVENDRLYTMVEDYHHDFTAAVVARLLKVQ